MIKIGTEILLRGKLCCVILETLSWNQKNVPFPPCHFIDLNEHRGFLIKTHCNLVVYLLPLLTVSIFVSPNFSHYLLKFGLRWGNRFLPFVGKFHCKEIISYKTLTFFLSLEMVILWYLTSRYHSSDARFVKKNKIKKSWFPFEAGKRQFFQSDCNTVSDVVIFWDSEREQKPL